MGPSSDRVTVFIDYQNTYMSARRTFGAGGEPSRFGQINPLKLGQWLVSSSPFDRTLKEVRVYRGIPSNAHDPRGYGAARRQIDAWESLDGVVPITRTLQYPRSWPDCAEKPNEKGIDVALAIDFAVGGIQNEYDVGILVSLDTDLKPPLEVIMDKKRARGVPRPEVAAFRKDGSSRSSRLSLGHGAPYCHWINRDVFELIQDDRDYNISRSI